MPLTSEKRMVAPLKLVLMNFAPSNSSVPE
jgi:hypothetical protein